MKISTIYDQGSALSQEDISYVSDHIFLVGDGVAPAFNSEHPLPKYNGITGNQLLIEAIRQIIPSIKSTEPSEIFGTLNEEARLLWTMHNLDSDQPAYLPGLTMSLMTVVKEEARFAAIGDARFIVLTTEGEIIMSKDQVRKHDTEMYSLIERFKREIANEKNVSLETVDAETNKAITREMWLRFFDPMVQARNQRCNQPGWYGLLNGQMAAHSMLEVVTLERKLVKKVILCTDGAVPYHSTKNMTDTEIADIIIGAYNTGGVNAVLNVARYLETAHSHKTHINMAEVTVVGIDF